VAFDALCCSHQVRLSKLRESVLIWTLISELAVDRLGDLLFPAQSAI